MSGVRRFEESDIWSDSRELMNDIYDLSDIGFFSSDYALKDQIRRAAISVMSNIAEGFESQTNKLFYSYLSKAKASCGEIRSQLYIALDRKYIDQNTFSELKDKCEKLSISIYKWMQYLSKPENINLTREETSNYSSPKNS